MPRRNPPEKKKTTSYVPIEWYLRRGFAYMRIESWWAWGLVDLLLQLVTLFSVGKTRLHESSGPLLQPNPNQEKGCSHSVKNMSLMCIDKTPSLNPSNRTHQQAKHLFVREFFPPVFSKFPRSYSRDFLLERAHSSRSNLRRGDFGPHFRTSQGGSL